MSNQCETELILHKFHQNSSIVPYAFTAKSNTAYTASDRWSIYPVNASTCSIVNVRVHTDNVQAAHKRMALVFFVFVLHLGSLVGHVVKVNCFQLPSAILEEVQRI